MAALPEQTVILAAEALLYHEPGHSRNPTAAKRNRGSWSNRVPFVFARSCPNLRSRNRVPLAGDAARCRCRFGSAGEKRLGYSHETSWIVDIAYVSSTSSLRSVYENNRAPRIRKGLTGRFTTVKSGRPTLLTVTLDSRRWRRHCWSRAENSSRLSGNS